MTEELLIIGGGLAGCEAALKAASLGVAVRLVDMKPGELSPAHHSPRLGELVCSNSLRSAELGSAVGLLKAEMALLGSAVMAAARASAVPAGKALAVDREAFAAWLDDAVSRHPLIRRESRRVDALPRSGITLVASGPLTAEALAADLRSLTGAKHLHFYDAIAPIVSRDSVDLDRAFWADRWDDQAGGDYLNCPLSEEEYERFVDAVLAGEKVPARDFEKVVHFEGCMPIEEMAERGRETLRFGPLKPVGLTDPRTGREPHAVVQLRADRKSDV